MEKETVMMQDNPRAEEFLNELVGPNGCNLRIENSILLCDCECEINNMEKTRKILSNMEGIDVEKSIEYFKSMKAKCDCEVTDLFVIIE